MLAAVLVDGRKQKQSAKSWPEKIPPPSCCKAWQRAAGLAARQPEEEQDTCAWVMFAVAVGATVLWEPRLEKPPLPVTAVVCCLLAKLQESLLALFWSIPEPICQAESPGWLQGEVTPTLQHPQQHRVKHSSEHSWEWDVISATTPKSACQTPRAGILSLENSP